MYAPAKCMLHFEPQNCMLQWLQLIFHFCCKIVICCRKFPNRMLQFQNVCSGLMYAPFWEKNLVCSNKTGKKPNVCSKWSIRWSYVNAPIVRGLFIDVPFTYYAGGESANFQAAIVQWNFRFKSDISITSVACSLGGAKWSSEIYREMNFQATDTTVPIKFDYCQKSTIIFNVYVIRLWLSVWW